MTEMLKKTFKMSSSSRKNFTNDLIHDIPEKNRY